MKILIYTFFRGTIAIFSVVSMYFVSHFWIGTKEHWQEAVETRFWSFFLTRFTMTCLIGLLFFCLGLLFRKIYWGKWNPNQIKFRKTNIIELIGIIVLSMTFVIITLLE